VKHYQDQEFRKTIPPFQAGWHWLRKRTSSTLRPKTRPAKVVLVFGISPEDYRRTASCLSTAAERLPD
jgi:hypothetical protein